MQRNLATKIQAKWESGLTAVRLKWDPPVSWVISQNLLPHPIWQGLCAQKNEKLLRGIKLAPNFVPNPFPLPLWEIKDLEPSPLQESED